MPCPEAALGTSLCMRGSPPRCPEGWMRYQAMNMQKSLPPKDCMISVLPKLW